jgi:hypothetical protein
MSKRICIWNDKIYILKDVFKLQKLIEKIDGKKNIHGVKPL